MLLEDWASDMDGSRIPSCWTGVAREVGCVRDRLFVRLKPTGVDSIGEADSDDELIFALCCCERRDLDGRRTPSENDPGRCTMTGEAFGDISGKLLVELLALSSLSAGEKDRRRISLVVDEAVA